jgi:acyl dehydratase
MAYSAALGKADARYFDTALAERLASHPLFPVCYEWPVSQPIRHIPELTDLFPRLVHAEHDLVIHRPARPGDRLKTVARIDSVIPRKPGAFVVFAFATRDARNALVSETRFGALYRGVAVEGGSRGEPIELPEEKRDLQKLGEIAVPANAAHVYTECARIWNPIHTDIAHARSAGLPDIILHGTATLALSISRVLTATRTDPERVRRVRCRFTGMVLMPSTLSVHGDTDAGGSVFETRGPKGESVIGRGRVDVG